MDIEKLVKEQKKTREAIELLTYIIQGAISGFMLFEIIKHM